ncbi:MAG: hypothetical protein LC732_00685 [Acidobacteria bacterium]|nr:hypothetical protein [Acidobacteriota bacterium]
MFSRPGPDHSWPQSLRNGRLIAIAAAPVAAQSNLTVPTYRGCLHENGTIYGVVSHDGKQPQCEATHAVIQFSGGDVTEVVAGVGLEGGAIDGPAKLDLRQEFRLPQACEPGETTIFNGQIWTCADPQDAAPSGHRAWIGLSWYSTFTNFSEARAFTRIFVLNPNDHVVNVTCISFNQNGNLLLDALESESVAPGAIEFCPVDEGIGWTIVSADAPVLPHGRIDARASISTGSGQSAWNLDWYPHELR